MRVGGREAMESFFNMFVMTLYLAFTLCSGLIPPELGKLGSLKKLGLGGNELSGEISQRFVD